jgi:hypothetical protein
MTLLDEVIEASGGSARWGELKRFTLQLSINGELLNRTGHAGRFKNIAAEGSTQSQLVRFTGFTGPDGCGLYQPDCVTLEGPGGEVLLSLRDPQRVFLDHSKAAPWDVLHVLFFCGFAVWNYLMTPFLLAHPEVRTEELPPWQEHGETWRRLRATFPSDIVTHSTEQTFYFDAGGLQRRTDHDLLGTPVAHYSWAHQTFDGITVPTLRRSLARQPDGTAIPKPALVDVEIFDATFE